MRPSGRNRNSPGERLVPPDDDLEHVFGPMDVRRGLHGRGRVGGVVFSAPGESSQEHQHQGPGDSPVFSCFLRLDVFPHVARSAPKVGECMPRHCR